MDARDPRTAAVETVRGAYGTWAAEYIARFGTPDDAAEDRDRITAWASSLRGPVLDAGCGPGHWTALLHDLGLEAEGVDTTPEFLEHARRRHPEVPFAQADLRRLDLAPDSLGGVLAWFSLIHLDPSEVPEVLAAFAAALQPGGGLLLGFFAGDALEPFEHRVVTAWAWPPGALAAAVQQAGFEVLDHDEQPQPSGRVFGSLAARKQ